MWGFYFGVNILITVVWFLLNWHRGEILRRERGEDLLLLFMLGVIFGWVMVVYEFFYWLNTSWRGWMDRIAPH